MNAWRRRRIHIQLRADVAEAVHQLQRCVEAIDAGQRRVGVQVAAVGRGAENAFDGIVEQAAVAPLGIAQRAIGGFAHADVLHDAFHGQHASVAAVQPDAALPYPALGAAAVDDAVLDVEAAPLRQRRIDAAAHAHAIFRMRQLLVGDRLLNSRSSGP